MAAAEQQSTAWFEFAGGMHIVAGMHPSWNVRASELHNPGLLHQNGGTAVPISVALDGRTLS